MSEDHAPREDWLEAAWRSLPDRCDTIVMRRLAGETLESIANEFDVTRERIRQLQKKAEAALVDAQRREAPDLPDRINAVLADLPAVRDPLVFAVLPSNAGFARQALFGSLGVSHPRTWHGELSGYWTRHPSALDGRLRQLATLAPMTSEEAQHAADELQIPADLPWEELLEHPGSKVVLHKVGWIRSFRAGRDVAYLWLREQGEPRPVADVAEVAGTSEHAIRETMRRDEAFAQVRPEGTWSLVDWRVPGSDSRYANAVDVVVEVLRDHGPLDYEHLRVESQRRYPVSAWRINQCMSSNLIGLNDQGLYDLAERGATPIEDSEPKQPKNIQAHGDVVGIELEVDHEVLRGSGIPVNRWLTWRLGLRTAPSTRYFALQDSEGTMTVKRGTSASQLSSLRAVAQALGVVQGCKIAVLLHLDTDTATARHTCPAEVCPAM